MVAQLSHSLPLPVDSEAPQGQQEGGKVKTYAKLSLLEARDIGLAWKEP